MSDLYLLVRLRDPEATHRTRLLSSQPADVFNCQFLASHEYLCVVEAMNVRSKVCG